MSKPKIVWSGMCDAVLVNIFTKEEHISKEVCRVVLCDGKAYAEVLLMDRMGEPSWDLAHSEQTYISAMGACLADLLVEAEAEVATLKARRPVVCLTCRGSGDNTVLVDGWRRFARGPCPDCGPEGGHEGCERGVRWAT